MKSERAVISGHFWISERSEKGCDSPGDIHIDFKIEVTLISEGCNLETLADRVMSTTKVE